MTASAIALERAPGKILNKGKGGRGTAAEEVPLQTGQACIINHEWKVLSIISLLVAFHKDPSRMASRALLSRSLDGSGLDSEAT